MGETILITGANRGLGLELTRYYAHLGWQVHACCRDPESAVELGQIADSAEVVQVHRLDVTDYDQMAALRATLHGVPIDILLHNAGTYGQEGASFGRTDPQRWLHAFAVNAIGPVKLTEALIDNVAAGERKLVAAMSSKMGSIADNRSGGSYVYRSSKTALNSAMMSAAVDLRSRGICVVLLHPGWVLTDMGGPNAELTVEESVRRLHLILDRVTLADSGTFFDIDGSRIPW